MGSGAEFAFIIGVLTSTIVAAYGLFVVKWQIPAFRLRAFALSLFKIIITIGLSCAVPVVINQHLQPSFARVCIVTAIYIVAAMCLFWVFIFDRESKRLLIAKIQHFSKR